MAGRQQAERVAVAGIDRDGLFEQRLRYQIVLPRHAPVMRQRAHHQIPGVHVVGRLAAGVKVLGGIYLRFDRRHHGLGDFVLHGEDVGEAAVVAFRPQVAAGGDVDELSGDAHLIAVLAHAAFDDVTDAEFLADLPVMDRLAPVDKGRVAGDHVEPAQLRQRGDDVLGDAFRKIFLRGFAADVDEGQHGNGWPVQRRQLMARRFARLVGWLQPVDGGFRAASMHMDVADEAKALACDGADHGLILAAVADRLAGGVDSAGQRGFGDDAAIPDSLDQVVLADDPLAVLDQKDQEVEHLGLDGYSFAGAGQFAEVDIKHMVGKVKLHELGPGSGCDGLWVA